jgi:hypothetical protein
MLKTIAAAAALLVIAGAVMIWSATGNVAASTPPAAAKGDRLDIRPTGSDCSQRAWPYYEINCVRDRKHPTGQARDVRLVALGQAMI